jgi:conjugal transfer pilus assembly protein TraB
MSMGLPGILTAWNEMPLLKRCGLAAGLAVLFLVVLSVATPSSKKETFTEQRTPQQLWPTDGGPTKWVAKIEQDQEKTNQTVRNLNETVDKLTKELQAQREAAQRLEKEKRSAPKKSEPAAPDAYPPTIPGGGSAGDFKTPPGAGSAPRGAGPNYAGMPFSQEEPIRVLKPRAPAAGEPKSGAQKTKPSKDLAWLPAGAMATAKLVTGVDAPTDGPPLPVLLSLSKEALGPSMHAAPVKGCLLIGEASGVLGTERALVKVYRLSCTLDDGSSISREVAGYVVGEDGRIGLPGVLVSRQGEKILESLAANFAAGFGMGLAQQETTSSMTALGGSVNTVTGNALNFGMYRGAGKSAEQLAAWLQEMAKRLVPVISVDAGRDTKVVFQRGTDLGELSNYAQNPPFSGLD